MATFKQYTKKNGEKLWQFKTYLGVNGSHRQARVCQQKGV
ncbi:hypothetical protein JOD16_000598 [Enterococcus xiangfangensis]|nr:hypothetical protein [Enterococcus xiangfangensis]